MALAGVDDDILQDFLTEAGEILERLGEQLIALEQTPQDVDLLNAVFRGFHTVKGGASFLNLTALVNVCHRAEDVFNILRQGQRLVDPPLMDAILKVLDHLNSMFDQIRNNEEPTPVEQSFLDLLQTFAQPGGSAQAAPPPAPEPPPPPPVEKKAEAPVAKGGGKTAQGGEDITDEEFDALLDTLQKGGETLSGAAVSSAKGANAPGGGEITDQEFENLLDNLQKQGAAPSAPPPPAKPASPPPAASPPPPPPPRAEPPKAAAHDSDDKPQAGGGNAAAQQETTVRVDTKRLDDIMNLVGELVLVRNRLETLKTTLADEEIAKVVTNLDVVTSDLQTAVMKTRMQPIKKVFGRFPRVVRDLGRSLKREIQLELQGEETEVDKNLVEALADPLVHLVRNACDHGIEDPDKREAAGKLRAGKVILAAAQEGDHILLTISDDGAGMDPEKLRSKVVEKGLMDPDTAARLSDHECYNLIFLPGFSTKAQISDISGRGVGMDVVKTRIAQLNGSVDIDSTLGLGSTIRIKVPLTLAILPTLMVILGKQPFALPLASVSEIFDLDLGRTNVVDGQLVALVRDKTLPLFYLRKWLIKEPMSASSMKQGHVVVVHTANRRVGFVVDHLIGQEEVVIKPLGALLHGMPGLAGATITGDGRIALILDVPSLLKTYARKSY